MAGKVDHSGHRKRLKERYKKEGINSFEIHNAMELLLFYGIPLKDTNEIAHLLINEFGSLRNVLDAPIENLVKVDGIGENAAILLKLINDITRMSIVDYNSNIKSFTSAQSSKMFCKRLFVNCTVEELYMICLDNSGNLIYQESVFKGTVNRTKVNLRTVVEIALKHNSASIILAHNHPRGEAYPSIGDIEITTRIRHILKIIDITLLDHIIVGENSVIAMSQVAEFQALL